MDTLVKGFKDKVNVNSVEENFENFESKKPGGGTMYCHKVTFELMDGTEYPGQVCSQMPTVPFKKGDILEIEVKSFTKGLHNFDILKIIPGQVPDLYNRGKETAAQQPPRQLSTYLNGTPGEIALRYAVQHHQYRLGVDDSTVLHTAKLFKEFLINNAN